MNKKMKPEEFVEWATGGGELYARAKCSLRASYPANDVQTVEY